ncbi:MAG: alpha/beta hydrolase family protein [Deinococcus sp.]
MSAFRRSSARLSALIAVSATLCGTFLGGSALAQTTTRTTTQTTVQTNAPAFPGDLRADAPDLSPRGSYAVGVRTLNLVHKDQLNIALAASTKTAPDPLPRYDRPLTVEVWYPATLAAGQAQVTSYRDVLGSGPGDAKRPNTPFQTPGRAARNAAPDASGGKYPLVIVSHGYPGSRFLLSHLGENLASKGYVAAAIDHTDSTHGDKAAFASTLYNRALDDNFVLDTLAKMSAQGGNPIPNLLDAARTALVGYIMGGYGALNAARAGFAPQVTGFVPGGVLAQRDAGAYTPDPRIKAIVAFAPWGGDAAVRAIGVTTAAPLGFWDAAGLAGLKVPSLFIVGDHDDVAGYEGGVKSLFENAVNSDRYMVVYQNARHNSAPNPPPAASLANFDEYMHYAEPAWDMARLNNLNQHFVTAFLNVKLKGMTQDAGYLNVPTPIAINGKYSRNPDGTPKADDTYWKGFKNRTAVGIELYHLGAK